MLRSKPNIINQNSSNHKDYKNILFVINTPQDDYFLAYLLNVEFNLKFNRIIKKYINKKGEFSYTCFCFNDILERQEWFLFSNRSIKFSS